MSQLPWARTRRAARAVLGHSVSPWLFGEARMINWSPTLQTSAPFHRSSSAAGGLDRGRGGITCVNRMAKPLPRTSIGGVGHGREVLGVGGVREGGGGSTRLNAHLVCCVHKEGWQRCEEDSGKQKNEKEDWTQLKVYTARGEGRDGKKQENSSKEVGVLE